MFRVDPQGLPVLFDGFFHPLGFGLPGWSLRSLSCLCVSVFPVVFTSKKVIERGRRSLRIVGPSLVVGRLAKVAASPLGEGTQPEKTPGRRAQQGRAIQEGEHLLGLVWSGRVLAHGLSRQEQQVVENSLERVDLVRQQQSFEGRAPPGGRLRGRRGPWPHPVAGRNKVHSRPRHRWLPRKIVPCRRGGGTRARRDDPGLALATDRPRLAPGADAFNRTEPGESQDRDADDEHRPRRPPQDLAVPPGPAPRPCRQRLRAGRDGLAGDEALNIVREVVRGCVAVFLAMCHRLRADGAESPGHFRIESRGRDRWLVLRHLDHFKGGLRRARALAGQDLVEGRPQKIDVAPLIDQGGQAGGALRRHVRGRSQDRPRLGFGIRAGLGQADVRGFARAGRPFRLTHDLGDSPVE